MEKMEKVEALRNKAGVTYEEAKAAYDKILGIYNDKGKLTSSDISNNGLSN